MKTPQPVPPRHPFHLPCHRKALTCKLHQLHLLKRVHHLLIQMGAALLPLTKYRSTEERNESKDADLLGENSVEQLLNFDPFLCDCVLRSRSQSKLDVCLMEIS